ncbi:MAG: PaaI family thioesterase [Eubacteriales bacterium]|nr:PaaI family thioesterase [Eubacteriales bacterium]
MKKKIVNKQPNSSACFVCGLKNDKGLKARFFETKDREVVALFTPHSLHQSYPGRLHGGIAACILDETIGRAVQVGAPDVWGVTVELTLSYKKPLPYDVELKAVGRITKDLRLLFEGEGEIYTPDGEVAVTAKARYVKMTIDKISQDFGGDDWKVHLHIDDPEEINII